MTLVPILDYSHFQISHYGIEALFYPFSISRDQSLPGSQELS